MHKISSGRTYCPCAATFRREEQQKNTRYAIAIIQEHTDNALTNQIKNTTTFLPIENVCSKINVLVSTV